MVGVSAGMYPDIDSGIGPRLTQRHALATAQSCTLLTGACALNAVRPNMAGIDGYRANSFDDPALSSGGHNPEFLYHLPSAYSFEPELPGLRDTLLRMWDAGVGMKSFPPVNLVETGVATAGGWGGTCTCPNGEVY
jgi:hypothetical protein